MCCCMCFQYNNNNNTITMKRIIIMWPQFTVEVHHCILYKTEECWRSVQEATGTGEKKIRDKDT